MPVLKSRRCRKRAEMSDSHLDGRIDRMISALRRSNSSSVSAPAFHSSERLLELRGLRGFGGSGPEGCATPGATFSRIYCFDSTHAVSTESAPDTADSCSLFSVVSAEPARFSSGLYHRRPVID